MRGPYKYELLPSYPHFLEGESLIWDRFILSHPAFFERVFYDVQVGDQRPNAETLSPGIVDNKQYLGSYKIDVVGENAGVFTLVEVKKAAGAKALGQCRLYEKLLEKQNPEWGQIKKMIVTDEELPNIREIGARDGINLFVV